MVGMVGSSPSETRAVDVAEAEAAAVRVQALRVDSSPSDTKAAAAVVVPEQQPVEKEAGLSLSLVASSPSETKAVEDDTPLIFFAEETVAAPAPAVLEEQEQAMVEVEEHEAAGPDPAADVVSEMLLMNGDGY